MEACAADTNCMGQKGIKFPWTINDTRNFYVVVYRKGLQYGKFCKR